MLFIEQSPVGKQPLERRGSLHEEDGASAPGHSWLEPESPNLIHFTMKTLKMNLPDLCRQLEAEAARLDPQEM